MIENTELDKLLLMATKKPKTLKGRWKFFALRVKQLFN